MHRTLRNTAIPLTVLLLLGCATGLASGMLGVPTPGVPAHAGTCHGYRGAATAPLATPARTRIFLWRSCEAARAALAEGPAPVEARVFLETLDAFDATLAAVTAKRAGTDGRRAAPTDTGLFLMADHAGVFDAYGRWRAAGARAAGLR